MSFAIYAVNTHGSMKELARGVSGMSTNMIKELAEDLKGICEMEGCYLTDVDEYGHEWYIYKCPLLNDIDDPENSTCKLGDPSSWDI